MPDPNEQKLIEFFADRLMPIAAEGGSYFPLAPDDSVSYYTDRTDTGSYVHEIDSSDMAAELRSLWGESDPQLAAIADELMGLADDLQETEDASDEISPFVYAMF